MERTRPASARRRPRRGSVDRPLDTRLVRTSAIALVLPVIVLFLTLSRTGPLPAPELPPSFDGATAARLTRELVRDIPSRVPGTLPADASAEWFTEQITQYGLTVEEDSWQEEVPSLGVVTLRNIAAIVRGSISDSIVVVAHRDNRPGTSGTNDNASGTAALVELARAYATVGTGGAAARQPLHTIVFLSTDGGAYGDLGARRFARSDRGRLTGTAIVLDGLAGRSRPHLSISGEDRRTAPTALVRTLAARLAEVGSRPVLPGGTTQLVALGIPLALGEQAPFLERRIPAVRFGTAPETARPPGTDELGGLDEARLGRLGRAVEATLAGLDAAPQLPGSTRSALVLDRRAISGWALELLLLAAVVPFGIAAIDLLARCRRRGTRLVGAWRAFRRRLGFWLAGAVALGVVAALGALPVSTDFPPRPDLPPVDSWPAAGIGALVLLGLLAWLRARLPLARTEPVAEEVELAGWAVALLALLGAAVLAAIANPYTLAFMLPSLYGWLALLQVGRERAWLADLLYAIGLLGPVVAVAVLSQQLELGFRAPLYAAALITSGTVPWLVGLALAVWLAVGAQVGALVTGRYSPVRRQRSSAR